MIAALVYQLTQNMCVEDIKREGFDAYFVDQSGDFLLHLLTCVRNVPKNKREILPTRAY